MSNNAGRHRRLLPKRPRSKKVYDRLVADVFVDGQNVDGCRIRFFSWHIRSFTFPRSSPLAASCELP